MQAKQTLSDKTVTQKGVWMSGWHSLWEGGTKGKGPGQLEFCILDHSAFCADC